VISQNIVKFVYHRFRPSNQELKMSKIQVTVIVNGQPTEVEANVNEPLHAIVPKALEQTHNLGQPPNMWELRDSSGVILDQSKKISDYGFGPGIRLFLNLQAGVGGAA
jgi:hypothetical protein